MVAFWGCDVTETKAAVVDVPEGLVLNVCNATCGGSSADSQVALGLETQQVDCKVWKGAVAHLGGKQPLQVKLDLVFGHKVKFYLAKGSGVVNLTGYFQPDPPVDLSEEEEEKAISIEAPSVKKSKKRAREEKKTKEKSWDEVSPSSSDSEIVSEKKIKAVVMTSPAKKEEQKNQKVAKETAVTSSNPTALAATSQKKKRKKKHKKQAANGEVK